MARGPATLHRREVAADYRSLPRRRWSEAEVREALREFHTSWGRPPTTLELVRPLPGASTVKTCLGVATLAEAWAAMGWGDQVLIRSGLRGEQCAAAVATRDGLRRCPSGTTSGRYCSRHAQTRPHGDWVEAPPEPAPDPWDDMADLVPADPDAPWLAIEASARDGEGPALGPQEAPDPRPRTYPSPDPGGAAPSDAEGPISAIPAQPVPAGIAGGIAATHYFASRTTASVLRIPGGTRPGWWEVMPGPGVHDWPARRILVREDGRHDPVEFLPGPYHFRFAGDVEGGLALTLGQLLNAASVAQEIGRLARAQERTQMILAQVAADLSALVDYMTRPE